MKNKKRVCTVLGIIVLLILVFLLCFFVLKKHDNKPVEVIDDYIENQSNQNQEEKNQRKYPEEEVVRVEENGQKVNISKYIQNAKFNIDGLEIKNIRLTEFVGKTVIKAEAFNGTSKEVGDVALKITLIDGMGNTLVEVVGYIGNVLPGQTSNLSAETTLDYSDAYDIKIEKR